MPTAQPTITFDANLPISAAVDEIRDLIERNQVVVVAGETGSGKTTQLPKIALLAGRKRIGHTQPRRLAARTVAARIAQEMGVEIGDAVGYQVRFTRQATRRTKVKLMTDGILLAEIGHDRDLRHYDTIIIDEAHERSLNIDFLLGYLKQLLPRRPDLKVIITSATIDTARFAEHFGDAPIVEVSGRTYPVEIVYEPLEHENDLVDGIARAVTQLHALGEGDILVFCSGERDIRDAADAIEALRLRNTEVLPLFARLSAAEQDRVFRPHPGTMRVVLATNVAETSLTVPGIRYVVDPGFARMSRYSARTKVQRLPIEPVSQASANQRAGRCGRLGPGIAIRLYSEDDFLARPAFTEPEILRTNLASVILQMADARLGAIEDFPFVEPPDRSQVRDGLRLLKELGALQEERASKGCEHKPSAEGPRLTKTGRLLARLPIDPRLGRMLVEAGRRGCAWDVLPVVAALAIPDVRERPTEKQAEADALHRRFWSETGAANAARGEAHGDRDASDIAAIWRLWDYLRNQRNELSGNAFRRMCRDEYLNFLRIREWQDLVSQLREIIGELDLDTQASNADADTRRARARQPRQASAHTPDWDAVHTAILAGLLSHVGLRDERSTVPKTQQRRGRRPMAEYLGARGARFAIQPGSAAAKAEPPLAMAVELVETTRLWARTVAPITAEQVEAVGGHLITRQYSEPRWSVRGGQCVADERVLLLGVPIVAGRTVSYGRIDPVVAREVFIQSALVEGQWQTRHHFFKRNERTRAEAEDLSERTRRRDILVDDRAIFAFYDDKVPADIVSVAHFDRWWRTKRQQDETYLDLVLDDLVDADQVDAEAFPETWTVGPADLPVSYLFEPGAHRDGVSVDIDVTVLNQVDPAPFTWQVPGLRDELATELIRSLPKAVRTRFVPAPDWGRRALTWLDDHPDRASLAFPDALAAALGALSGEPLDATLFNESALPDHLTVRYVITDGRRELGAGKDFESLRKQFAPRLNKRLNAAASDVAHPGAKKWEFGTIPATREVDRDPTPLVGYPALVDQGETVGVRIANTAAKASRWQARGLRRLVMLESPDPTRSVFIHLSNAEKIALSGGPYANLNALLADVRLKATGDLIAQHRVDPDTIRDEASFRRLVDRVRPDAAERMQAITRVAARILTRHAEVRAELARRPEGETRDDITAQLDNLVFDGFIAATPEPHFTRLDKYLHAVDVRLKGWTANPARELQNFSVIAELEDAYAAAVAVHEVGELPAAAVEAGWLLEELRVSLFAQSLGTAQPVSAKRVRGVLAALS